MALLSRVLSPALREKITSAEEAAALIRPGANVGMSGFTGAGYPKAIPQALARRIEEANGRGERFQIDLLTGASTASELDGTLAKVDGIRLRLPYNSDPILRDRINKGQTEYADVHLSHVAQLVSSGFLGKMDLAVIEVAGVLEDGRLIPSSSIGNNNTWIDEADGVILEVNSWQNSSLEGMHDVYNVAQRPPHRRPIPIIQPADRIGSPYLICPPEKVLAVVETNAPDRNSPFSPPDENSRRIAGHIMEFLTREVEKGRLPENLLPLQSGVGNIANAVLQELMESPFENLSAYTEVIQDGMIDLMKVGKVVTASAAAFSLSTEVTDYLNAHMEEYRRRIILRPQSVSNNPEVIRRLGCLAMNGIIEVDIYGNINSTHVMGTRMQNGIGGSGDFARNAYISFFMTPSVAKGGAISCIVPMVSHVDHTEHDVDVMVTEQGLADLRGLSPKQRAERIIENCAHPDYRPALREYYRRALEMSPAKHTPHLLEDAFSWHLQFNRTGSMRF